MGLTWTLTPTKATLLTNSLALFVTLAGGQLWTIVRFGLHQRRAHRLSSQDNQQARHQQLILRNAGTDLHTMRLMALLAWRSRQKNATGPYRYAVYVALLAIVHYIVFVVAGTLSNNLISSGSGETFHKLVNASSPVLSRSPFCGFWEPTYYDEIVNGPFLNVESPDTVRQSIQFNAKIDGDVGESLAYAEECYGTAAPNYRSSKCNTMKRSKLWVNQTSSELCPFDRSICHSRSSTIVFETPPIDTHTDLGINAPPSERLTYRKRTSCAALDDAKHVVQEDTGTSQAMGYAYYGPYLDGNHPVNYTYVFSNFSSLYTIFTPLTVTPYQITAQVAYAPDPENDGWSAFAPIQGLRQTSADTTLFFLSYAGRYLNPIHDPWFSATTPIEVDIPVEFARTQYVPDSMITTLGCTEQHQFCTPDGNCTPFEGLLQISGDTSFSAGLTARQNVTFDRMLRATYLASILKITNSLQATKAPMLANTQVATSDASVTLKLPDIQWQLELEHWHNVSMAHLQRTLVNWATGQIASDPRSQLVPAKSGPDAWFCRNLIVPSTVYQSFCVVWLSIILAAGTFVIVVSWTIEEIPSRVQFRSQRMYTLRRIWDQDHILGLSRRRWTRSWMPPPPPPKESSPYLSPYTATTKVNSSEPTPHCNQFQAQSATKEHADFSWFHVPVMHSSDVEKHLHEARHGASTSRLWSQLPPEPPHDSWVAPGFQNHGFNHPVYQPPVSHPVYHPEMSYPVYQPGMNHPVHHSEKGHSVHQPEMSEMPMAPTSPSITERRRPAKSFDLSNLRAHALARNHGLFF